MIILLFFLNDTPTTEIYTYLHSLSLHDALPIWIYLASEVDALPGGLDDLVGHRRTCGRLCPIRCPCTVLYAGSSHGGDVAYSSCSSCLTSTMDCELSLRRWPRMTGEVACWSSITR